MHAHQVGAAIELRRMDWLLLRRQKQALVEITNQLNQHDDPQSLRQSGLLDGLINLLDYIQDAAADFLDLDSDGSEIVFGPHCQHEDCGSMADPFTGACYEDPQHPPIPLPNLHP